MNESVTIILPLPPRVLNPNCTVATPGGRFAKAAASKKMRRITKDYVEAERIETAPWKKANVAVTFYFPTKRRRDQDNMMASLKAIYDGIVDSGLLEDDDYDRMPNRSCLPLIDKDNPRVQLVVRRLE